MALTEKERLSLENVLLSFSHKRKLASFSR